MTAAAILALIVLVIAIARVVSRLDDAVYELRKIRALEESRYMREQQIFGPHDAREDLHR